MYTTPFKVDDVAAMRKEANRIAKLMYKKLGRYPTHIKVPINHGTGKVKDWFLGEGAEEMKGIIAQPAEFLIGYNVEAPPRSNMPGWCQAPSGFDDRGRYVPPKDAPKSKVVGSKKGTATRQSTYSYTEQLTTISKPPQLKGKGDWWGLTRENLLLPTGHIVVAGQHVVKTRGFVYFTVDQLGNVVRLPEDMTNKVLQYNECSDMLISLGMAKVKNPNLGWLKAEMLKIMPNDEVVIMGLTDDDIPSIIQGFADNYISATRMVE
jgi:hypothetical protein